ERGEMVDHGGRAPEGVAVGAGAVAGARLAALEGRLDAAEAALVGTSERGVEGGVWGARRLAEAVPVVGAVALHRQEVEGRARHRAIEVFEQGSRRRGSRAAALPVHEAADLD